MNGRMRYLIPLVFIASTFYLPSANATQCWINGSLNLDFGAAGGASPATTWGSMTMACYAPWAATNITYHVRICHFISADPQTGTVSPRYLTLWDGSRMQYDLYADPSMSQILGPPGNSNQLSSIDMNIPGNSTGTWPLTVYGRVPARQAGLAAGVYQSHFSGGLVRWRASSGNTPTPTVAECLAGTGGEEGGEISYYLNVIGTSQDTCLIRSVTDLNFGTHEHLISSPLDQRADLTLQCPVGTAWQLSINNGIQTIGGKRFMTNSRGMKVEYGLYRDAARLKNWGSNLGVDTLSGIGAGSTNPVAIPIYGRVPPQNVNAPGQYQDTVIVTLSY